MTDSNLKFIFFGTPEFSADILTRLVRAGFSPCAVVTNPDRPQGRKKLITPPPVKAAALGCGSSLDILQPEVLDEPFVVSLAKYSASFGVLAAYGKIMPKAVIDAFPNGIIVVHPSLLPKYRGATPIQSVILAGDHETGTTLFVMDEKVDHGPILIKKECAIADADTYETLAKKLSTLSAELLIETIPRYTAGEIVPQVQDEVGATYTKKIFTEDAFVDLEKDSPEKICRMVRALNPEPGVFTVSPSNGGAPRRMKILEAECVGKKLVLKKVQFEGRTPRAL